MQDGGGGKLGFLAKTAVDCVISPGNAAGNAIHLRAGQFRAGGDPVGVFLPLSLQLGGLVVQAGFILSVGPPHFRQHCQQLVGRQISSPGNGAAVRRQQGGSRPAADIVAGIHFRAVVVVHPYRHKVGGDEFGHRRVNISGLLHHLTPVAPDGGNRQQDGLVLPLRPGKGRRPPRQPIDARFGVQLGGQGHCCLLSVRYAGRRRWGIAPFILNLLKDEYPVSARNPTMRPAVLNLLIYDSIAG